MLSDGSLLLPRAQKAPQQHEFSEMVRIVIRGEERLAENYLAVAMRDFGVEVGGFIGYEIAEGLQICAKCVGALFPGFLARRFGFVRPIAARKIGRFVFGVARELENIPLRDAEMFKHLPRRMLGAFRKFSAELGGHASYGCVEMRVSFAFFEQFDQMLPKRFVVRILVFHLFGSFSDGLQNHFARLVTGNASAGV